MDAQALALRAATFDIAALIFMLFHVPDPAAALREVRRVLRPVGSIGLVTWGVNDVMPGAAFWKEELDHAGAAPDPRDPRSMQKALMDTPDKLTELLQASGFPSVRVWTQTANHQWAVDDIVRSQIGCGAAARRIGNLSREAAAACLTRVRARLDALSREELMQCSDVLFAVAV